MTAFAKVLCVRNLGQNNDSNSGLLSVVINLPLHCGMQSLGHYLWSYFSKTFIQRRLQYRC